jgi:hypothetical protein
MKSNIQSILMVAVAAVALGSVTVLPSVGLQVRGSKAHNSVSRSGGGLPTSSPQGAGGPVCTPSGAGCSSGG